MPYFLLGLAVVVGIYLIYLGMKRSNPQNVQKMLVGVIFAVAFVLLGYLAATGRFGPLGWAVLALPLLLRWRNIAQAMRNMGGPTPGGNSDVETLYLRMTLEHDSGVLRGTVLDGAHKGRNLDEMPLDDLLDLLRECRVNDPESATILESYLDRVHGANWRGAGDGDGADADGRGARASSGGMTRDQAYNILGLQPGASPDEIREAHRKLLKANHPDRGGSTWLAAQINLAKDILLPRD